LILQLHRSTPSELRTSSVDLSLARPVQLKSAFPTPSTSQNPSSESPVPSTPPSDFPLPADPLRTTTQLSMETTISTQRETANPSTTFISLDFLTRTSTSSSLTQLESTSTSPINSSTLSSSVLPQLPPSSTPPSPPPQLPSLEPSPLPPLANKPSRTRSVTPSRSSRISSSSTKACPWIERNG